MKIYIKIAVATSMLFSLANATSDFKSYNDMCEKLETQECPNNTAEVKNLQIALNADKNLKLNLTTDGKWGENTKLAVVEFQKQHNILPAEGYVGTKTKKVLNTVAKNVKLPAIKIAKKEGTSSSKCYADFRKNTNLKKSFKVFKDKKLLAKANGRNTKLKVDVSEQRLRLYVNNKVALDSPCTTGAKRKFEPNTKIYRDKHTPTGTYKVREKIADKRSTIFGDLYRHGKKIYHGDRRKYRGSWKGVKYVGASLKHWMRLTSGGIGLHASKYVKRYPGTNGCIRLPYHVAKTVFKKIKNGTKVSIVN
jgi:lipoprotein-anchoring transpeptidase ErfK/SrfK